MSDSCRPFNHSTKEASHDSCDFKCYSHQKHLLWFLRCFIGKMKVKVFLFKKCCCCSVCVQSDWVRRTWGHFQSQEDLQRTRAPERVHLVSRKLHVWERPSNHPRASWRKGVHTRTKALHFQWQLSYWNSLSGCSGCAHCLAMQKKTKKHPKKNND